MGPGCPLPALGATCAPGIRATTGREQPSAEGCEHGFGPPGTLAGRARRGPFDHEAAVGTGRALRVIMVTGKENTAAVFSGDGDGLGVDQPSGPSRATPEQGQSRPGASSRGAVPRGSADGGHGRGRPAGLRSPFVRQLTDT